MNLGEGSDEFDNMSDQEKMRRLDLVKEESIDTACAIMDIIDSADCKTIEDYQETFQKLLNRINITDVRFYNYLTSKSSRES